MNRQEEGWGDEPNPGSRKAIDAGCRCATTDNHYGSGYRHWDGKLQEKRVWITSGDCFLHWRIDDDAL